jgi:hypothetical protein
MESLKETARAWPQDAGTGWLLPARAGQSARNPGPTNQPGKQAVVGLEVIFGLGVVVGIAATKATQKAKEKIKHRLSEEVESILEGKES